MKSFVYTVLSLLLVQISFGQAKIDPILLNDGIDAKKSMIIAFHGSAQIVPPIHLKGKVAKANYVYQQLVSRTEKTQAPIIAFLQSQHIPYQSFHIVNAIKVETTAAIASQLAKFADVYRIVEDSPVKSLTPELYRDELADRTTEWGINKVRAPEVWALGYSGQNIVIGGQDTGYEWQDLALKNKYRGWNGTDSTHTFNWHDAIEAIDVHNTGNNPCGLNIPYPCDDNNHGTHTMGTMVGDDGVGNQIGVAPSAKWIGCRNMERGWGTVSTYLECFEWFLAPYPYGNPSGANPSMMPHVINNSWGCPTDEGCNTSNFGILDAAVNNLRNAGCVVVVSAGNSGSTCGTVNTPAAIYEGSFSIGATDINDNIAGFSSRGAVTVDGSNRIKPNVSAPGVGVRSCIRGPGYASYSGTSMAGPHVAGVVALLINANPMLDGEVERIETILEQTAIHLTSTQNCNGTNGTSIPNNTFGFGRVDALAAVQMSSISSYGPYVILPADVWIPNATQGLVMTDANNTKHRVTVSNSGQLQITLNTTVSPGSTKVQSGSIQCPSSATGIVLTAPNGSLWRLSINASGNITTTAAVLNNKYISLGGDLNIATPSKGLVIRDAANQCHLINVSTLGQLITIPSPSCP